MKFFYKLLLSLLLLLTAALSAGQYYSAEINLEYSFQRELERTLSEHQLVKYSIQTAVLNVGEDVSDTELAQIAENVAALTDEGGGMLLASGDGSETYYSSLSASPRLVDTEEGIVAYRVSENEDGGTCIVAQSYFSQNSQRFALVTEQDISQVFSESEALRSMYNRLFLIILGVCVAAALGLSLFLTRPLVRLQSASRRFADGDYGARVPVGGRDEVGELSRTFNSMARTVEDKIGQMEETIEREKRFTASFAHELKTPMTSIIGYADTIYQKELPPEEARQAAWYIMNEGLRLESLSFKLMDLIAMDSGHFLLEELEISSLLRETADAVAPLAEKRGAAFTCQAEPGWVRLECDLFKTLLLNLLDNALKSGGDRVELRGSAEGESYTVRVSDNGRGIPREDMDKITEAFYMVDKSRARKEHGAGLGLSLCKRIADIHGAALRFDSEPGRGTAVSVTLKREADGDEA